ncbi:unnamed protein product [Sordaria macrospora k-hell]|uniref:WGS project CABT00000000 data, contig 2.51 n=1 Tax=Sordaria macrospora (strain ATCC MYA-333 / DSM 997 / K(L3346) / K-hell) TaxID=771870 RepID=F7W9F4_SORMK|nr:uncharacterized protein SMAC_12796 [Sordaria macrospora k-hell]KAH7635770.1 hypothetical protein B0T09DRAFT_255429 [Sordaria sp. MPI-SDFR-AT-0083]CCC13945.1 unnamed protein product [Sordaria macrospora k-hell]
MRACSSLESLQRGSLSHPRQDTVRNAAKQRRSTFWPCFHSLIDTGTTSNNQTYQRSRTSSTTSSFCDFFFRPLYYNRL